MNYNNEEVEMMMIELAEKLDKTIYVLSDEYANVRTGRANPKILDKVLVDYYGTMSPINQVANIAVPESRMITITPWDASMAKVIEKAIIASNLGITPSNDGKLIRMVFPEVNAERRKELSKKCKAMAEDAKVATRNIRRDAMDKIKKMKTAKDITEDEAVGFEAEIEKAIAKSIEKIEEVYKAKDKEVLSV